MKSRIEVRSVIRPTWCFRTWPTLIRNYRTTDGWREIMLSWLGVLVIVQIKKESYGG